MKKKKNEVILLSAEELAGVFNMQNKISNMKIAIADGYMALHKAMANIEKMSNEYVEEAKKVARSRGIDIDSPDKGQWNLDLDAKTLTKAN